VTLAKTRHVIVKSNREIPLFVDGERVNVGRTAEISFIPDAVNVIVPERIT
jgi:diacylglycerol kinase family enzyme